MGATNFLIMSEAKTAREAYNNEVENAVYWAGHDTYNGTISTTDFVGTVRTFAETWDETNVKQITELVDTEYGYGEKWECRAIDCGKTENDSHMWALFGWAAC